MHFIEIDGIVINQDKIISIERVESKFKSEYSTKLNMEDGSFVTCGADIYFRLKNYLKPLVFESGKQQSQ